MTEAVSAPSTVAAPAAPVAPAANPPAPPAVPPTPPKVEAPTPKGDPPVNDDIGYLKRELARERKLRLAGDIPEAVAMQLPDPVLTQNGWDPVADAKVVEAVKALREWRGVPATGAATGAPQLSYDGQPMSDALIDRVRREQPKVYATKAFQDALWQYKLATRRGYGRG